MHAVLQTQLISRKPAAMWNLSDIRLVLTRIMGECGHVMENLQRTHTRNIVSNHKDRGDTVHEVHTKNRDLHYTLAWKV